MKTFQDLVAVGENEINRMEFVHAVIRDHQSSDLYFTAKVADEYARHKNRTIMLYQKMLYTVSGSAVPDNWTANYKLPSNFFYRFITQQNQFLLGNGVTWENSETETRLGDDFDKALQTAGQKALVGGVSFGFFNLDHIEVFDALEFCPLYDEENGALMAGVRYWQLATNKPLRATLYEMDGYTEYMWKDGTASVLQDKRAYKLNVTSNEADGVTIYNGENYPSFPIVPFYANPYKQSEIVGIREKIDAYDLISSGFCNDLDDASQIYWTIKNAGGMDDIDLAEFVQRMKTVKAFAAGDGQEVESHAVEVPYNAREAVLERLRRDLYRDYMALDIDEIAGGAATATQIKAAYEPMNNKADQYEYCVLDFIKGILAVAGIDDNPTFTRSYLINRNEEIQSLIQAAEWLDGDYITEKLLSIFGDADRAEEIIARMKEKELGMNGAFEE